MVHPPSFPCDSVNVIFPRYILKSLSAIEVKTDKNILVPSHSEKSVDISMGRLESVQLENTFTYFTSDCHLLNGPQIPDQVIDESFPWDSQPFKLKLINNTDKDKLVGAAYWAF